MSVDDSLAVTVEDAGATLRSKRTAAGLSIPEVAGSLKLTERLIEAIESNDQSRFPPVVYLRGYVRNYARLLGLDPEPLVDAYQFDASVAFEVGAVPPRRRSTPSLRQRLPLSMSMPSPVAVATVGLALTALVAIALLYWLSPATLNLARPGTESTVATNESVPGAADGEIAETGQVELIAAPASTSPGEVIPAESVADTPVPEDSAAEPATDEGPDAGNGADDDVLPPEIFGRPDTRAAVAVDSGALGEQPGSARQAVPGVVSGESEEPVASGDLLLVRRITPVGTEELWFEFAEDCWVEIYDTEGSSLYQDLLRRRQSLRLIGAGPFQIRLGYAPGVALEYNGEPIPLGPHTRNNVAMLVVGQ